MGFSKKKKQILVYIIFGLVLVFSSNLKEYAQSASEIKEITAVYNSIEKRMNYTPVLYLPPKVPQMNNKLKD